MGKPTFVLLLMLRNCYKCEMYALNQRFMYSYSLITFFRLVWLRDSLCSLWTVAKFPLSSDILSVSFNFLLLSIVLSMFLFFPSLFCCFVHQPRILIIILLWNSNHQVFRFIFLRLLAFGPDFKLCKFYLFYKFWRRVILDQF